ncbi:hypothetical protein ACFC4G_38985 [Streptomyces sp. NPDC056002]|uniref:hypothetical protein n=1 Tax=Streptomyces sp. NPDC056002 TaxID=3345675 RepID=UPI0035E0846C
MMVQIGGIGGGIFLLVVVVVVVVWRLRYTGVPPRFRANPWLTAALVMSSAAILFLAVYAVLDTLGLTPGS